VISISVVLPNRNHGREAEGTIRQFLEQTRPPDEIIVVDDGSQDDSVAQLQRLAQDQPTVKVMANPDHRQVPACVNQGVAAARGEFILLAAANDRRSVDMIERLADVAMRFTAARLIVSGNGEWNVDSGQLSSFDRNSERGLWFLDRSEQVGHISPDRFHRILRAGSVPLGIGTALIRRDALVEVGTYLPDLRWHSDWFAIHAIAFRHGFYALDANLCWNRSAEGSYSSRGMHDPVLQREVVLNIVARLHSPQFADLRRALERSPAAMSTFIRVLLPALAARPRYGAMFLKVSAWWLGQMLRGRRPDALRRAFGRLGLETQLGPVS
jgi:glycosyltransferase involved in cell wall biosynthesis